ncbi:MAG: ketopantoate reductase family protein [Mycobacterium leprae]
MDILVYGAGVLGSLYAARLKQAGQNVTILARDRRYREIRHHSIVLEDERTGRRTRTRVRVVSELRPDDAYDLVLVVMRKDQVQSVLAPLAANRRTPKVLFMVNNAAGPDAYVSALGADRVLLGFPGAGGARLGHVVRYRILPRRSQPTTIGELDGRITDRLWELVGLLEMAGFPTVASRHMDAWLKTHVAVVSPIANALYYAGDNYRLAQNREGLQLLARAVREGMGVLRALRVPIVPFKYRLVAMLPVPFLALIFRQMMGSRRAELVMMRHARVAVPEMKMLADEFMQLARGTPVPTPAMDRLYQVVQETARVVTVVGRG